MVTGQTTSSAKSSALACHNRSFSPASIDFQKSPLSDFYTARDLSRLRRSLGLFSAFQKLCHLLGIFLDCSWNPCRSLLISKPTLCKTILSSSFVLESRTKTDKLFFSSLQAFTSKSREKQ